MRAADFKLSAGEIRGHEITAARQTLLLTVERNKNNEQRGSPKTTSRRAAQHRGDRAPIVIRARAHRHGIVMSAYEDRFFKRCLRERHDVRILALPLHPESP